jgi:hypothetical protein
MSIIVGASWKSARTFDPTVYPVDEKVGENTLQRCIVEMLRPLLERWLRHRGVQAFVGADQFIYYRPHTPTERVSPDIYVLPGVPPGTPISVWKTWEKGIVPSFGLEIVSRDWEKDYVEAPERYAAAGIGELVVFDPAPGRHPERVAWQHFRRVRNRPLTRVEVSRGDRIRVAALGCTLRAVGQGEALRLRVGTGPRGEALFPTGEEAERAAKEAERAEKEAALAEKEAERAAKEVALTRVAELEAQLRKRRRRAR